MAYFGPCDLTIQLQNGMKLLFFTDLFPFSGKCCDHLNTNDSFLDPQKQKKLDTQRVILLKRYL